MPSELLTHQFFALLAGAIFHIELSAQTIDLRLDRVTPLPPLRRRNDTGEPTPAADIPARAEPFSLFFKGPPDTLLPQQTYRMMQESVPEPLDIFIVPVGREEDGFVYQAVFG